MKTLNEQIEDFKAKGGNAGGRKWKVQFLHYSLNASTIICNEEIDVACVYKNDKYYLGYRFQSKELASITLESALCEAINLIKSKVIELATELEITLGTNKIEVLGKAENNVQNDRTIFQIASSTKPTELIVIHNGHKVLLNDKEV